MKTQLTNKSLLLFFCLFICTSEVKANDKNSQAVAILEEYMQENLAVGLSVSVGVKNKIIFSKGFGYADLEQKIAVDPSRTLFRIGSVSKPLTSIAIGLLHEKGLLDLDKPIQNYVPNFPLKSGEITTRLLAGHLAGIRHYKKGEFLNTKYYPTVLDSLDIFQLDKLLYKPGSKFSYSSYGWNLISAIIENAAGENFLDYMESKVFKPLNLNHTQADDLNKIITNRGRYYKIVNSKFINAPYVDNSYKWASGGYLSTSEDLVQFGFSVLNPALLKKETLELLVRSQQDVTGKNTDYGLGWASGTDKSGRKWFGHNGGSIGGSTHFRIYPEEEVVVVLIANMSRWYYGDIPQIITDLYL